MTQMTTCAAPLALANRVEWARLSLEEAAARLAADPFWSRVYIAAVIGRSRELTALRDAAAAETR